MPRLGQLRIKMRSPKNPSPRRIVVLYRSIRILWPFHEGMQCQPRKTVSYALKVLEDSLVGHAYLGWTNCPILTSRGQHKTVCFYEILGRNVMWLCHHCHVSLQKMNGFYFMSKKGHRLSYGISNPDLPAVSQYKHAESSPTIFVGLKTMTQPNGLSQARRSSHLGTATINKPKPNFNK